MLSTRTIFALCLGGVMLARALYVHYPVQWLTFSANHFVAFLTVLFSLPILLVLLSAFGFARLKPFVVMHLLGCLAIIILILGPFRSDISGRVIPDPYSSMIFEGALALLWCIASDLTILLLGIFAPSIPSRSNLALAAPIMLAPTVLLVLWSLLMTQLIPLRAAAIAAGRPYCMVVPVDYLGKLGEVTSKNQLQGLKMRTPFTNGGGSSDFQFAYHAVLVVGNKPEYYNWSYRKHDFDRLTEKSVRAMHVHLRAECDVREEFFH